MKPPTSFTRQQAILRCPRRFYYRYISVDPRLHDLRQLSSVRELGGQVIHDVLATAVRRIASGERISDQTDAVKNARNEFNFVVEKSIETRPGLIPNGPHLAESYNGVSCLEQVKDWREIIPVAVENGIRLMHHFDLRGNKEEEYELEAEQRVQFRHRGREHRFVMDVLIQEDSGRSKATSIIDWKTHSITDKDLDQITLYQKYMLEARQIPLTRIYGYAVNLLREEVIEHHYRRIEQAHEPNAFRQRSVSLLPRTDSPATERYPARPSIDACSICAYVRVCSSSALNSMAPDLRSDSLNGNHCEI